jgi:hypothetical protein
MHYWWWWLTLVAVFGAGIWNYLMAPDWTDSKPLPHIPYPGERLAGAVLSIAVMTALVLVGLWMRI